MKGRIGGFPGLGLSCVTSVTPGLRGQVHDAPCATRPADAFVAPRFELIAKGPLA